MLVPENKRSRSFKNKEVVVNYANFHKKINKMKAHDNSLDLDMKT